MLLKKDLPRPPLTFSEIEIMRVSREESFDLVFRAAASQPIRVAWINTHCINIVRQNKAYQEAVREIEVLLNDGAGIEIAAKVLKTPVVENLVGTDWIPQMFNKLSDHSDLKKVYLLGATAENIEDAAENFKKRWPKLQLVGYHQGYWNDTSHVLSDIKQAKPEILVLGLGVPLQELFLQQHWPQLTSFGIKIAAAGGAILDHLAAAVTRAPNWMRRTRMEWFYRLVTEPKRLWRRYLIGNTTFFLTLFQVWAHQRKKNS